MNGNILIYVKTEKNELKDWFNQVKSPSFTCPKTECQAKNDENTIPLVKVVECTTQGAIYEYDFKVFHRLKVMIILGKHSNLNNFSLLMLGIWWWKTQKRTI